MINFLFVVRLRSLFCLPSGDNPVDRTCVHFPIGCRWKTPAVRQHTLSLPHLRGLVWLRRCESVNQCSATRGVNRFCIYVDAH
jgi:hypothetical protein